MFNKEDYPPLTLANMRGGALEEKFQVEPL